MYLILNGYILFIFINRAFHQDSFKIKMFVLFLFLDKVVNCSDFFCPCHLGMSKGNPHKWYTSLLANSIVPRRAHGSFVFKTKGE